MQPASMFVSEYMTSESMLTAPAVEPDADLGDPVFCVPPIVIEPQSDEYMREHDRALDVARYSSPPPLLCPPPQRYPYLPQNPQPPGCRPQLSHKWAYNAQSPRPPPASRMTQTNFNSRPLGTISLAHQGNVYNHGYNTTTPPFHQNINDYQRYPILSKLQQYYKKYGQQWEGQDGAAIEARPVESVDVRWRYRGSPRPTVPTNRVYIPMTAHHIDKHPTLTAQLTHRPPVSCGTTRIEDSWGHLADQAISRSLWKGVHRWRQLSSIFVVPTVHTRESYLVGTWIILQLYRGKDPMVYYRNNVAHTTFQQKVLTKIEDVYHQHVPTKVELISPENKQHHQHFHPTHPRQNPNDEDDDMAIMRRCYVADISSSDSRPEVSLSGQCFLPLGPLVSCAGLCLQSVSMIIVEDGAGEEATTASMELLSMTPTKKDYAQIEDFLPLDIKATVTALKLRTYLTSPGEPFFGVHTDTALRQLSQWCWTEGSPRSYRDAIFTHLAEHMHCDRDMLMQHARMLVIIPSRQKLKGMCEELRKTVATKMPWQVQQWDLKCSLLKNCQQKQKSIHDKSSGGEALRGIQTTLDSSNVAPVNMELLPKRIFSWSPDVKQLVWDILNTRISMFPPDDNARFQLIKFVESNVTILWPKGWMDTKTVLEECLQETRVRRKIGAGRLET